MKQAGLSDAEKEALRSEDVRLIQGQSQSECNSIMEPDGKGPVTAILNGALTLPPVVIVWAPPRWVTGYSSLIEDK